MVHTFKQIAIQNVQNQLTLKMSRIKALNLKSSKNKELLLWGIYYLKFY